MQAYLRQLFEYHDQANQLVWNTIYPVSQKVDPYVYKMFTHAHMTQHVWQRRIRGLGFDHEFWELLEQDVLKNLMAQNQKEFASIIEHRSLDEIVDYHSMDGKSFRSSIVDILTHVSHHFSYHRGQIAKSLRDSGIKPPDTDLILFRR